MECTLEQALQGTLAILTKVRPRIWTGRRRAAWPCSGPLASLLPGPGPGPGPADQLAALLGRAV
jgi:hypothetical protein